MISKIKGHIEEFGFKSTMIWLYNCFGFKLRMRKIKSEDFDKIEIKEGIEKFLTFKKGPNVFIVASIPYYDIGGGQRCSQLAKTFNKMGYNVIYLYAFKSSESVKFELAMPMSAHIELTRKKQEYFTQKWSNQNPKLLKKYIK